MEGCELDEGVFLTLLEKLIGEAKFLQNNPPEHVAVEDRAGRHVLELLRPYSTENGGPLHIEHLSFEDGRGNIKVTYPGEPGGGVMSFVGCHLDVVTADPTTWSVDPFKLTVQGDKLYGRGTTDCLGHVALLAELFRQLGMKKPNLKQAIVGIWIANEENSKVMGVGVDELVKRGHMKQLLNGPLYWVDTADSMPCIGTGGVAVWQLTAYGKLFHSGLPHKSVNPLELCMEALKEMQERFYRDFPAHPEEERYGFATPSTMKPTQFALPAGSVNQIPGECTISGDIRVTPFYDVQAVIDTLKAYVDDINAHVTELPTRGPCSKYVLPDEDLKGRLEIKFFDSFSRGVACNLESEGFKAMEVVFSRVYGKFKPFAITGSLPCIRELQEEGFDVQTMGFGNLATYHAVNEYALLSDFKKGFLVMSGLVDHFNK